MSTKTRRLVRLRTGFFCVITLSIIPIGCGDLSAAPGAKPTLQNQTIFEAFPPPNGAVRNTRDEFGEWLVHLRVLDPGEPVRTFRGDVVSHHARVVDFPMVPGDLQQCADSAIRLRAEWLKTNGRPIAFHATSGDLIPWKRWASGERPIEKGNHLVWVTGGAKDWDGYLKAVFTWAGTRSLVLDTEAATEPHSGDLILVPGSPGHVLVILDVASTSESQYVLIGEGYMPAQSFHVEIGPNSGWWLYSEELDLGHVVMPTSGLRRWRP